ncbi:MAG: KamA family radical SAM protein [Bacteroidota bacterium]
MPQIKNNFSEEELFDMEVVGTVLPFRANNYVVDELIDWSNPKDDPIFRLTFPQKEMLLHQHYEEMSEVMKSGADKKTINETALKIRNDLNPHPAGQADYNVPVHCGEKLGGVQHKYNETVLFFPRQGQTCHAYCTFCFRWPQFVSTEQEKFAAKEAGQLIDYIRDHKEITDLLITGGDPMVMKGKVFANYIDTIIDAGLDHLQTIRIGTKSLAYWPYKFTSDKDADLVIGAFEKIVKSGKHLSIMAHFNHYKELQTREVRKAVKRIISTGAQIRTQSPIFAYINDSADVWAKMWRMQVKMKMVPYYMFMARDTGAQHYFKVTAERAWKIFREAYQRVSGLARTVRGPVMSCAPGKVQFLGVSKVAGEKVFTLRFIQGRNPDWVHRPFFAKFDKEAIWIDDLIPAFGEENFFFEDELEQIYHEKKSLIDEVM